METLETSPKRRRRPKREYLDPSVKKSILASFFGIFICMVVFVSITWAWFTKTTIYTSNKLTAANYTLLITVFNETDSHFVTPSDGKYHLDHEKTYKISMKNQVSTASTGFCSIGITKEGEVSATAYYTPEILKPEKYSIRISGVEADITLTPVWGKPPTDEAHKITNIGTEVLDP